LIVSDSCLIRRADIGDAAKVIAGIDAVCVEGGAFYTTRFSLSPRWQRVLYRPESMPDHLLVVAEQDSRFVGAGRLFPGDENTMCRHIAELGMFILKPYRHQGIGTQMLTWMLDWATQAGIEKVTLSVFATNEPALCLYRKFNFIQEGCLQRQIKQGSKYIDFLLMARFLPYSQ
jgi:RimJ/RimL family protein N-acetyltransferase